MELWGAPLRAPPGRKVGCGTGGVPPVPAAPAPFGRWDPQHCKRGQASCHGPQCGLTPRSTRDPARQAALAARRSLSIMRLAAKAACLTGRVSSNVRPRMAPHVRVAKLEDRHAILALMVAVIRAALEVEHQADTIENVSSNLAFWTESPERCVHLVAEAGGALVGVVLVKEFWNLSSLFVAPSHQGRGLGRRLVLEAIAACREGGREQAIYLNAAPNAVGFYAALGFEVRESKQRLPPGFKAMRYQLAASEA